MAFDWNFTKIKQQALAKYDKQYWGNVAGTYTNMGGRINWDKDTGKASYNAPNIPLPSLPEMWGQYQKGAKSRGAVADFMTFKKYYEQLKTIKRQQLIGSLQQAEISGIPLNKIHDAIKTNPGFRDELVKTIANTTDENQRAALAAFVPPIEKTFSQYMTPGVLTGLGATGLAGYGLSQGMVDDTPEGIAERTRRTQFSERQRLKSYIDSNPRPKAPLESKYKTAKGNFKKGQKAKYTKDQAAYKKKLDTWKAGRPQVKVDPKITRWSKFSQKMGGPKSAQGGLLKGAAAMYAPEAIGMLARSTGLNEQDTKRLQGAVATGTAGMYGASFAKTVFNVLKSGKGAKALFKLGPAGMLAGTILMGAQAVGYFSQAESAPSATSTKAKKKYEPII